MHIELKLHREIAQDSWKDTFHAQIWNLQLDLFSNEDTLFNFL